MIGISLRKQFSPEEEIHQWAVQEIRARQAAQAATQEEEE